MLLPYDDAMYFIDGYKTVLLEVLHSLGETPSGKVTRDLVKARDQLKENPQLLHEAIKKINARDNPLDVYIEQALLTVRVGRWVHLRNTKKYALMLDESLNTAYAVRALTTPLHELSGSQSSIFEAAIFEYKNEFLCDGLVVNPIHIGTGLRADLNNTYIKIKENGRFYKRCVA
jgi:hypothetical protein